MDFIKEIAKGISTTTKYVINNPYLSILISIIIFFLGFNLFKKGLKIKNVNDPLKIKGLAVGLSMILTSLFLFFYSIIKLFRLHY
jgi:Co/Zn/Cd efflux system component